MAALMAIGVRGVQLSVDPATRTVKEGTAQRWSQVKVNGRRGDVVDRNGRRLATSVPTPNIVVDPLLIEPDEIDGLARKVAEILDRPVDDIAERMGRESRYVRLAVRVHPDIARRVERLGVRALWVEEELRRYYPEHSLAAQVLGFVDGGGRGVSGLERGMDDALRGGTVLVQRRRDRRGLDVFRPAAVDQTAHEGMTVHTTLDRHIQYLADRAMQGVEQRSAPESASAVVIDVRTGDILAMANTPTFNPNQLGSDPAPRRNHVIQDAVEAGSVFKPFTVAAALREKIIEPDADVDCEGGGWNIGRTRIHDDHPHGVITLSEVIKYSSNIGSAKLALRMGAETFFAALHDFGFGARSGVPLPGERAGIVRDPAKTRPIELATTAYGQGVTSTPLQLAMATAALANDGVRMQPRLVTEVVNADGVLEQRWRPTTAKRVVSPTIARQVTEMMVTVTEPGGTALRAQVPGYRVAGKTGTAQKVEEGRYTAARIGSFVGFLPADDPRIAIVVVVDEPTKGSRYGGIVAAPAFAEIGEGAMRYLGVPPSPGVVADEELAEDDELVATAAVDRTDAGPLTLTWSDGGWVVPDFAGKSRRELVVAMQQSGVQVKTSGSGRVVAQRPEPGTVAQVGDTIAVVLR